MKKIWVSIGMMLVIIMPTFALQETWFGTGFEFGNTFELSNDADTIYLGAPGVNLSMYTFYDKKPFGMVVRGSMLFPVVTKGAGENGYGVEFAWTVGPAGRLRITDAFFLYGGLGLNCLIIQDSYFHKDSASEKDYRKSVFNIGIGGDIGVKYDMSDYLYVNIGCTMGYFFYNSTSIQSHTELNNTTIDYIRKNTHVNGYSVLAVKPYIGIGCNFYTEGKAGLGKPR